MATRGTITVQHADGTISQIYSHFDNYLDHNGILLRDHYDTVEKVEALVSLGAISSLGPRLAPDEGERHTFEHRADGVTVAYHRDRGEDLSIHKYRNVEEFYSDYSEEEYNYFLRNDGTWFVSFYATGYEFVPLTAALNGDYFDDDE